MPFTRQVTATSTPFVSLAVKLVTVDGAAAATVGASTRVGSAVAVNVTGARLATVAERVFAPAVGPSTQLPTVATPTESLDCRWPTAVPPPLTTANVTATPLTAFESASRTTTAGLIV